MNFSISFDTIYETKKEQSRLLMPTFKKYKILVLRHLPKPFPRFKHKCTHSREVNALNAKRDFSNQIGVFAEERDYTNKLVTDSRITRRYVSQDYENFFTEYTKRAESGETLFFHELNTGLCKFFIDFDKKTNSDSDLGHAENVYRQFKGEMEESLKLFIDEMKNGETPQWFTPFLNEFRPKFIEKTSICASKFSVHFIISNLIFWNAANVGKFLMEFLVHLLTIQKNGRLFNQLYNFIDWGVYKKHTLRIYYSHKKADERTNSLRRMDAFIGGKLTTQFNVQFLKDSLLTYIPPGNVTYICYDETLTDFVSNTSKDYLLLQEMYYRYIKAAMPMPLQYRIKRLKTPKMNGGGGIGGGGWFDYQPITDRRIIKMVETFLNEKMRPKLRKLKKLTSNYVCKKGKLYHSTKTITFEVNGKFCFVRNKVHKQAPGKELSVNLTTGVVTFNCPFNEKCKRMWGHNFYPDQSTEQICRVIEMYVRNNC